jgi:hypothetical protein
MATGIKKGKSRRMPKREATTSKARLRQQLHREVGRMER